MDTQCHTILQLLRSHMYPKHNVFGHKSHKMYFTHQVTIDTTDTRKPQRTQTHMLARVDYHTNSNPLASQVTTHGMKICNRLHALRAMPPSAKYKATPWQSTCNTTSPQTSHLGTECRSSTLPGHALQFRVYTATHTCIDPLTLYCTANN